MMSLTLTGLLLSTTGVRDRTMQTSTESYEGVIKRRKVIYDEIEVHVEVGDCESPLTDGQYGNYDKELGTAVQTDLTFGLELDITTPLELQPYKETIKELQSDLDKVKRENTA